MKEHRIRAQVFVSFHVVGAIQRPCLGRAPAAPNGGAVAHRACSLACQLIENYHFFTTRTTTCGAYAILKRVYICHQN